MAANDMVLADGGLDALIWVAVMVLWGVAQVIGQKRKQKRARSATAPHRQARPAPAPREEPESDPAEQLREFFEQLGGHRMPEAPPPQRPQPAPEPIIHIQEVRPHTHRASPHVTPIREYVAPTTAPMVPMAENMEVRAARVAMRSMGAMRSIRLPSLKMPSSRSYPGGTVRDGLRNKGRLRDAMVNMIVLSPPKGLR